MATSSQLILAKKARMNSEGSKSAKKQNLPEGGREEEIKESFVRLINLVREATKDLKNLCDSSYERELM